MSDYNYWLEQVSLDYNLWTNVPEEHLTEELLGTVVKHDGKVLFKLNKDKRTVNLYSTAVRQIHESTLENDATHKFVTMQHIVNELLTNQSIAKGKDNVLQVLDLAIWVLGLMRGLAVDIPAHMLD